MALIENLNALTTSIRTVTEAGGSTTSEYDRVHNRWDEYNTREYSAQAQLGAALLGDAPMERIGELHGLALAANASNQEKATVHNALAGSVYPALRDEYSKTAESNYKTLAKKFNETAATFAKACASIPPETPAEQLIHASEAKRRAWTDAGVASMELTAQLPALIEAARLAGLNLRTNDDALGLTIKPGELHRRLVWEAWHTNTGRTGRWGAILTLGAPIEATPLNEYTHYREARPIETRYEYNGVGHRPIEVDPEDGEFGNSASAADLEKVLNRTYLP